jgi:beta-lactamase class A
MLRAMIVRSGNREATAVRDIVGDASLQKLARRARMKDFATAPSWGGTQISAYDQARFFWRIDAYVPQRHRAYARSLLAGIVDRHRWGIPPALPEGWAIFFKGGWHQPHRANQAALLQRGRERIAIAVLSDGNPSFGYGQATITGVSRQLLDGLNEFTP